MRVVTHELKCRAAYFDAVEAGQKPFEVRRDDRGFQRGDRIRLKRCDDGNADATRYLTKTITYILTGGQFGIEDGFVVLGFDPFEGKQ